MLALSTKAFGAAQVLGAALCLLLAGTAAEAATTVRVQGAKVNGFNVDKYTWTDSKGLVRTVSLKREGGGNAGHGGYAVQMTYQSKVGANTGTIIANAGAGGDGGFGYFVAHERERTFTDNQSGTIAAKIFRTSDSPLGRQFPVVGRSKLGAGAASASHTFTMDYPKYGTITAIPRDMNGNEVSKTPVDPAQLKKYLLHVSITWVFQADTDFPRIDTVVDLSDVAIADRVNFDMRGPYGVLIFDNGKNGVVSSVMWGDRYRFRTTDAPVTKESDWVWNTENRGSRYHALIAGGYEMGLVEPRLYAQSLTVDGFSNGRAKTSGTYFAGNGCPDRAGQKLPCDWEWPYQSLQYSLSNVNLDEPTTGKKIAWGTAPFYGAGATLPNVYDSETTSRPFNGFPDSKRLRYSTCVVLGKTVPGGLSATFALGQSDQTCARSAP